MKFRSLGFTIEQLIKEADSGNHGAQAELSLEYLIGEKIGKDISQSIHYMELASEDIYAINMCFKSARETGEPAAYLAIAFQWDYGFGVSHNSKLCAENLLIAAEKDNHYAKHLLGDKYRFGFGVEEDCLKSECWHLKALEGGVTESHFDLYLLYAKEEQLIDYAKAWFHLQESVKLNHPHPNSYLFMGEAYMENKLTLSDKIEATKWFLIAQRKHDYSAKELENLKNELTQDEWNEAEARAQKWIEKHGK